MNKPLPGSWRCSYFDQNPPLFLRTDGSTTQRNKDGEEVMITNTCSINSCRSNKCLQKGLHVGLWVNGGKCSLRKMLSYRAGEKREQGKREKRKRYFSFRKIISDYLRVEGCSR
ncbi:hypothetical protein SUGI_1133220 [Cryptomeria japonica]|nr:hypothetical protein SUGI_1133220 [Cryptomeria japonica]